MYEHVSEPLLHRTAFLRRALRHALSGFALVLLADGLGVLGYRFLGRLPWIDAIENASMILGGMGPVDPLKSDVAKLFAAVYALFSGLMFIGVMAIVLTPWVHRLMHKIHLEGRKSQRAG